jgi:hydroxymethylpyrimidine pyrophosphatase-like HAD family hydrolase
MESLYIPEDLTTPKTHFINDIDGTTVPYKSDIIHEVDLAAMRELDEHSVYRVQATARPASKMENIFRQSGATDAILDGGVTILADGVEYRDWLTPDLTEETIAAVLPFAHYLGYNGKPSIKAHKDILSEQPALTSPTIFTTYMVTTGIREAIRRRLTERGLEHLLPEFNPYHGSDIIHCVQIGLANKALGVAKFQEMKGLMVAHCASVGDGEADRGLHMHTSMRFAMGNSVPALLNSGYAHTRVRSVDEQGYSQATQILLNHNDSFTAS